MKTIIVNDIKIKERHKEAYSKGQLDKYKTEYAKNRTIISPVIIDKNKFLVKGYGIYLMAKELNVRVLFYLDEFRENKEDKLRRKAKQYGWEIEEYFNGQLKIIENTYDGIYFIYKDDLSDRTTNVELYHQNYMVKRAGQHHQETCKPLLKNNGKYYDAVDHLILVINNHKTRNKRTGVQYGK